MTNRFLASLGAAAVLTAMVATRELAREPGATIIHNLITSRAVPEIVTEHGGIPVRTRVGHSFIKAKMAETNAIFGGEHSGHFYFRDFWYADSGMLAALHTLAVLGTSDRALSELGGGRSTVVKDPIFAGSDGGLAIARDATSADWDKLSL